MMSSNFNNKYWWFFDAGFGGTCVVCNSKLTYKTPLVLERHNISKRHIKKLEKFKSASALANLDSLTLFVQNPNQNLRQKRSLDPEQNPNAKKKRIEHLSAIKYLYDFYLSPKIVEVQPELKYLKGQFLIILNEQVILRFFEMLSKDGAAKPFSLFLEDISESEDTSRIGIIIRYYSDTFKKFICLFLNNVRLKVQDPQNKPIQIINAIEKTAKELKLQLKNLIGIGVHASSQKQMHDNRQVFQYLKSKYDLMNFHPILCISDSLQKASLNALSESFYKKQENWIKDTYNWFYDNRDMYKILYDLLNVEKIQRYQRQFDEISWFYTPTAVKNLLRNWDDLKEHFNKTKEQCPTANNLYHIYGNKFYKEILYFLEEHLHYVTRVNKKFECSVPDAVKMLDNFIKLRSDISSSNKACENHLRKSSMPEQEKKIILEKHGDFVKRFIDNLDYFDLDAKKSSHRYDSYDKMRNNLKKLRFLNSDKKNIIALTESVDDITKSKIISEWNELQTNLSIISDTTKLQESWEEIFDQKDSTGDNYYQEISFLAMKHFSLPFSDINVKRIFHQINYAGLKQVNDQKLAIINNILRIQHYLTLMNERPGNNPANFLDIFNNEFSNNSTPTDRGSYQHNILDEEDEKILFSMKNRLDIG